MKNYYSLLDISKQANEDEIRQAYRRLAFRYHPDRRGGAANIERFHEIKEAYEVLSNPVSRSEYHHKRWLNSNSGNLHFNNFQVTPALIEKEAQKIARYIKNIDVFRMNYDALLKQLEQLLNPGHLAILLKEQRENINESIIRAVLQSCHPLPYPYLGDIQDKLVQLAGTNNHLLVSIHRFVNKKRSQYLWEKYKAIIMISIALIICIGIYSIA